VAANVITIYYEHFFFSINGADSRVFLSLYLFIIIIFFSVGRLQAHAVYLRSYTNNDFVSVINNGDPLRWIFSYTSHYIIAETRVFRTLIRRAFSRLAVGVPP